MSQLYACPCCHWVGLSTPPYATWPPPAGLTISPPYEDFLGKPTYEVCVRCSFEFGNDDNPGGGRTGDSFESYRSKWIARGRPWLGGKFAEAAGYPYDEDQFEVPPALEAGVYEGRDEAGA